MAPGRNGHGRGRGLVATSIQSTLAASHQGKLHSTSLLGQILDFYILLLHDVVKNVVAGTLTTEKLIATPGSNTLDAAEN
jgi:hypothetical protein